MSTHGKETMVEWLLQRMDVETGAPGDVYVSRRVPDNARPIAEQAENAAMDFAEMCWRQYVNTNRPLPVMIVINVRRVELAESWLLKFTWTPRALTIRP